MGLLEEIGIRLLWFDSLGAKCASVVVESSAGPIVIDPGAAEMQPSYPLPSEEKIALRRRAIEVIEDWCRVAKVIVITHYHYDHHVLPSDHAIRDPKSMWFGAELLVLKNPNMYINESQWERARLFLSELLRLVGEDLTKYMCEPKVREFPDPVESLSIALSKNFGDYQRRREELLAKGRTWFRNLVEKLWSRKSWIEEITLPNEVKIMWGDGKCLEVGDTVLEILNPWFHGIEYDRTGWVTPIVIKRRNYVVFYSSDLMGPMIEDYAEYIARLRPDVVILDGPPTYLFPYMLNRVNLKRAVDNAVTIVSSRPKLLIYDHHLLREKRWRSRVAEVFEEAEKCGVEVLTAAEYLGRKPLIDTL